MATYTLACAYLWVRQDRLIFAPQKELNRTPADVGLGYRDLFIPVGRAGEKIHAWWIPAAAGGGRTLLYLHGSALNISANVEHTRRFHRLGFAVLLVSYRGYGVSEGAFPSERSIYADAEAAWRYLVDERQIPARQVFLYGHSLGGAVAIELAVRHPDAAGVIAEATFTSIYDMARQDPTYRLFPIDLILKERFDSLSKVDRMKVPILYLHGTADRFVPPGMSRSLFERSSSFKRLQLIPGGGHNNSAGVGGMLYLAAVTNFVKEVAARAQNPR
jgi:pimeloyl-ACP methyl ester carboxylesterase